ncbi:hypothetical protein BH10PSE2_BH10PSE2_30050 [soil metagenome]
MARRLNVQRLIGVMGVAVLGLGGLSVWAISHGARPGFIEQPAADRALKQVRDQRGADFELRYSEPGRGKALCGYAGPRVGRAIAGVDAVAFVSRPNRILFSDDPLKGEFQAMRADACPTFLAKPADAAP